MEEGGLLLLIVVVPFLGSILAAMLPTNARNAEAWLAGSVAFIGLLCTVMLRPVLDAGRVVRRPIEWIPSLGLDFGLRMDGYSWMFAVMICGIGLLVVIYARYYMSPEDPVPRFFSFLLAFMGSMLGLVLSGNLVQLVFFWEMTSLFSFLLIGYWHHNPAARDGARMSLTVTATGGLALLAGVLLLGHIVGSYDLDAVLAAGDVVRASALYHPTLVLILLGAFTKSAQVPFHFWLPNAMAAPTPVSAYLHSATMVKAGIFLLTLLWPVLSGTEAWFWLVSSAGALTLLVGAYAAIFQQDLKGILAYSTISHLGLITLLLGLGSPLALVAAIFHTLNHATFKASLFMAAGVIDHEAGTRDMRRLRGLLRRMPYTGTLAIAASAAMAGVPLFNGFISKEMFFAEAIDAATTADVTLLLPAIAVVASMLSVVYSLRFIHTVFFGPPATNLPREPHEPARWMRFPIEALVLLCIIVGVMPGVSVGPFLERAVIAVLGDAAPQYSLAVWHGFNLPLVMSVIALAGGVTLYILLRRYLHGGLDRPTAVRSFYGQMAFEYAFNRLSWTWPRRVIGVVGTSRLQPQIFLIVVLALVAGVLPLWRASFALPAISLEGWSPAFTLVWGIGAACAVGTAYMARFHRLAALILMGGTGLVVCVTFAWLSAPDLAITQLLVELVTTVLILLGLRWLPKRNEFVPPGLRIARRWRHFRDISLAVGVGTGLALVSYAVMVRPIGPTIGSEFLARAYPEGGGTNVVNVILVDFRAFDTLGEITVLSIVAISVFALLRRFRPAPDSLALPEQQILSAGGRRSSVDPLTEYMLVPRVIMHWLFPVIAVIALYFLLRGHDMPGGGFAAGIIMSIAFIVQYMAREARWVEDRLRILPLRWISAGLLLAAATGMASWLFGLPFLTSYFAYAEIPLIGRVPIASALIFDIGVFLLVVGATVLMLIALAHQTLRADRSVAIDAAARKEEN